MITPRLEKIIEMIKTDKIADIGTDHAYIPIKLAQQDKIKKAIACDLNKGPLQIAAENIERYNFSEIIETRLGDGLNPLKKDEVTEIIIAGMGGKLISDIIEENIDIANSATLILQPMNAQYELRKKLFELGFKIESEELSKEGYKIYNIIVAKVGCDDEKTEFEYHIPKSVINHPLYPMLYAKKKREFSKILNGNIKSENKDEKIISYYKEMLFELEKTVK